MIDVNLFQNNKSSLLSVFCMFFRITYFIHRNHSLSSLHAWEREKNNFLREFEFFMQKKYSGNLHSRIGY